MKLIDFDGQDFNIADEALLVRPIREMFQADKTKGKEKFWRQISYMWFMYDPRSSYMYITDSERRGEEVKRQEGFPASWSPDDTLNDAMEIYRSQTTTTSSILLEGMRTGINKLVAFFNAFDPMAVDKNDRPIYQVSTMTAALKQVPDLAKALADAEKALAKDFATDDKARGSLEKAIGEDI